MVFLGIIVVLFSWVLTRALKSAHRASQSANCIGNLKQIGLASHLYAQDHDGRFPENLFRLYPKYASKIDTFFCPSAPHVQPWKKIKRPEDANMSYLLIPGLTEKDNPDIIIVRDKSAWNHNAGLNSCYIDGHVGFSPLDDYIEKDFDDISSALQTFFEAKKRYPTNEEGLKILVSSGFLRVPLFDPFDPEGKRPYGYACPTSNKWILTNYGPDKKQSVDLKLYAQGKLTNEDLMKMKAQLIFGMMTIKRTNGDIFRVGP